MEKIKQYVQESINELRNKVTWPTWANLQSTTTVVLIGMVIFTALTFVMDAISKNILKVIYP